MNEIESTRPRTATDTDAGVDDRTGRRLDWLAAHRERLHVLTQETRFRIVQKVIGHPEQLPTLKELDYFLRDVSESTIRNHLAALIEADLVTRVELPDQQRTRDHPHVFYGLTETGRDALEATGLLETADILQEATRRTEVRSDVKKYMDAPRPEWDGANSVED